MAEVDLMRHLMKHATRLGARLFRQQVGQGWIGKAIQFKYPGTVEVRPGDVLIRKARPFHAGVPGMSDTGGWTPVVITPEMVGSTLAVVLQAEIKENGRPTPEQLNWIEAVRAAGGRAGIARNEEDLEAIIRGEVR